MEYSDQFLSQFSKRMKSVGRYAILFRNSSQKTTWKQFGFEKMDEQINMLFTILLFIMEMSLKEEKCTLDDIAGFIDEINQKYYKKDISYDKSQELAEFVINIILCDEGHAMYFDGYDYDIKAYKIMNISYIANKVIYLDDEIRRTSYYLTDDGYNLLLSTLELENNLKLTVHEMLFQLHLEKAAYDKAVEDVKNVFNQLRIQIQKMQEAMRRIRQNALNYTVDEYRDIIEENLLTIQETRNKFNTHREMVRARVSEYENEDINIEKLSEKDEENLNNLRIIESFLGRAIDEQQKILSTHFELKELYSSELESLSEMTMIQRFNLRTDIYNKIIENISVLDNIDYFFRPLFSKDIPKIYNINKAFEVQQRYRKNEDNNENEELVFDVEEYYEEQERLAAEKLKKYSDSIYTILKYVVNNKEVTLSILNDIISTEEMQVLVPQIEIFREIIIEMLSVKEINIEKLRNEKEMYFEEKQLTFQINETILKLVEDSQELMGIKKIYVTPLESSEMVTFRNVKNQNGEIKNIRCSDVKIWYE